MRKATMHFLMACVGLGLMAGQAPAGVVTYIGTDPCAGPGSPIPNSDAAAANFNAAAAALGSVSLITFESCATGQLLQPDRRPGRVDQWDGCQR